MNTYELEDSAYRGLLLPKKNSKDFPNPTQSHLHLADVSTLEKNSNDFPNTTEGHYLLAQSSQKLIFDGDTVLDLGCGTGFLGNYLAKNFALQKVVFSDMSKAAIEHSKIVHEINNFDGMRYMTPREKLEFRLGPSEETLIDINGAKAVCAPMFIPRVCEVFPQIYGLFSALAKQQNWELYVGHSNLANNTIEDQIKNLGVSLEAVNISPLISLHPEYSNEDIEYQLQQQEEGKLFDETIDYLKPLGLEMKGKQPHHRIQISKIS